MNELVAKINEAFEAFSKDAALQEPLRRAHWMPTLGDPGAHAVGVPSRHGDPREDNEIGRAHV